MKRTIGLLLCTVFFFSNMLQADEPVRLSSPRLTELVQKHFKLQNIMFSKDSTVADVDKLFALYTDDFIYNHPGQGDIYSRELLYNNSVRYIESNGYDGSFQKKITNIITGLNAATVEWIEHSDPNTKYMTLIEFSGAKIAMMKEYW